MLTDDQLAQSHREGFLVIEDVIEETVHKAVLQECAGLIDDLFDQWHAEGKVPAPKPGMGFWEKLEVAYQSGFDWYQPLDISLPHGGITELTDWRKWRAMWEEARYHAATGEHIPQHRWPASGPYCA